MSENKKKKPRTYKERYGEEAGKRLREVRSRAWMGSGSPKWNGGKFKTKMGYLQVKCPHHPYSNNSGYVMEHRLVMEKHLGRVLLPDEVVHHINNVHDDNRIENLMLFSSKGEHARHHNPKGRKVGTKVEQ
jgi:hypothetical protein